MSNHQSEQYVPLYAGDEAVVRLPTSEEKRRHQLRTDEPVLELRRLGGGAEVHRARGTTVVSGRTAVRATEASQ